MTTQNRGINPANVAEAPVRDATAVVVLDATVGVKARPMIIRRNVMNRSDTLLAILSFYLLHASPTVTGYQEII